MAKKSIPVVVISLEANLVGLAGGSSDGSLVYTEDTDKLWVLRAGVWVEIPYAATVAPSDADYLVKTANAALSAERVVTDTGDVSWDWATAGQAKANIVNDSVSNLKIRNSSALSVIGRSANSVGDPADITATAASGQVLRESGSTLGFGTVVEAGIANNAVTYTKMQNISATQRVLGRNSGGAGAVEEVTVSQELDWVSSTRGNIPYRGAAGWNGLAPGTLDYVLTSNGAGADPSYQPIPGYVISLCSGVYSAPVDAETVFWGQNAGLPPAASGAIRRVYIPFAGTIKAAYIFARVNGTAPSNEAWAIYIRKNNTTDTLIQSTGAAATELLWSNTGLTIAMAAGDYFEIKSIAPTWATNPTNVHWSGNIYVQYP